MGNLNTARGDNGGAAGIQTAALYISGTPPTTQNVEEFDGSSWTETDNVNTGRYNCGGAGTTTAALLFGGRIAGDPTATTETYNGSSWTEVGDINTARYAAGEAGAGPNTSTLYFGGSAPLKAITEEWNGSSWTEVADLSTARDSKAQGTVGTSSLALAISGGTPGATTAVEEWTVAAAASSFTSS